jgi:hypothetical protein
LIEWWNWKKNNFNKNADDKIRNEEQNEKPNIWEITIEGLNWKE